MSQSYPKEVHTKKVIKDIALTFERVDIFNKKLNNHPLYDGNLEYDIFEMIVPVEWNRELLYEGHKLYYLRKIENSILE